MLCTFTYRILCFNNRSSIYHCFLRNQFIALYMYNSSSLQPFYPVGDRPLEVVWKVLEPGSPWMDGGPYQQRVDVSICPPRDRMRSDGGIFPLRRSSAFYVSIDRALQPNKKVTLDTTQPIRLAYPSKGLDRSWLGRASLF